MGINYPKIEEGDSATAASLNSLFTAVATEINDLNAEDVDRFSLSHEHLVQGLIPDGVITTNTQEVTAYTTHEYDNIYPGYDTDTFVDPPTAGAGNAEWNVVNNGTEKCRLDWSGDRGYGTRPSPVGRKRPYGTRVFPGEAFSRFPGKS